MIWLVKFSSANWVNPLRKSLYSTNVEKCLHVMRVSTDVKLKKKTRYVRSSSVLPFLAVPDPYDKVRKVYMPCASNDIKLKKKKKTSYVRSRSVLPCLSRCKLSFRQFLVFQLRYGLNQILCSTEQASLLSKTQKLILSLL